jgi:membrane protein DedA with SNARE-associated domain
MGLIRMPLKKFLIFGGLGTAVRLGIMAFLGWLLQETYAFYAYRLESLSAPAAAALAIGFIAAYLMVKKKISLIVIDKP